MLILDIICSDALGEAKREAVTKFAQNARLLMIIEVDEQMSSLSWSSDAHQPGQQLTRASQQKHPAPCTMIPTQNPDSWGFEVMQLWVINLIFCLGAIVCVSLLLK